MKSYKTITFNEICEILEKKYPDKMLPFVDYTDIPNNYLKMHGYAMKRRGKKR